MSRKLMATTFLLTGTLFAATVFGGDLTTLVEKVPSMFVINDEAHALPVRDMGGRDAFSFFENDSYRDGEESHFARFTVPEGKRLVIESLSIQAALPLGQDMILGSVQGSVNGHVFVHHLGPTFLGQTANGNAMFLVSEQRTLYADGGTEVTLTWLRNAHTGGGITNASLAGHLVDCDSDTCK